MTQKLEFQLDWLPPFDETTAEGLTFAALRLLAGGQVATELEDLVSQTLRDSVHVSVYPLAWFLVSNWWRLRWEPAPARPGAGWRLRHSLSAVGEGYTWPDITFASDGEAVHVQVSSGAHSATAPVRYVTDFAEWVPAKDFERAVQVFVESVVGRLQAMECRDRDLASLWAELEAERLDPEASRWRRLEAMAGYDPDQAPEDFVARLLAESEQTGWAVLEELAAASRQRALEDLRDLRDALRQRGVGFRVTALEHLQRKVRDTVGDLSRPPWQRAAEAAQQARLQWGLNGEVLSNHRLGEILDLPERELGPGNGDLAQASYGAPYSASLHSLDGESDRLILNRRPATSRRFAACRLLGDRLYSASDDSRLSAATNAYTSRQKFQRAFAQEFLCPFDALQGLLDTDSPTEDDIEGAAEHFQVSPLLVRTALVNRRILPRDALDGQYG